MLAKECLICYKYRHFDVCCSQNKAKETKSASNACTTLHTVRTAAAAVCSVASRPQGCPSPPISLHIKYTNKSGKVLIIPDTGADTTVIGLQHLQALGISVKDLLPPPELQFSNADGSPMEGKVLGSMNALMTLGDISYKGYIDVLSSLPTPLLCYDALRHLRIIPWDFPKQVCESKLSRASVSVSRKPASQAYATGQHLHRQSSGTVEPIIASIGPPAATASPEEAKQYFLKEYSDVLMTKEQFRHGTQLKPMTGPPMRIHLKEDARPFAIHTPRLIPLAFQDDIKREL